MEMTSLTIKVDASDIDLATIALGRLTNAANEAKAALDRLHGYSGRSMSKDIEAALVDVIKRHQRPGGPLHPL